MKKIGFWSKQSMPLFTILLIIFSTATAAFSNPLFSISVNGSVCSMTLSGLPAVTGTKAGYKVYLNTDDGGWYMQDIVGNGVVTFQHTYRTAGGTNGFHPYFEYVEIYDDTQDPPPKRVLYDPATGGGNGSISGNGFIPPSSAVNSTLPPPVYNNNGFVHILPVRKMVADHEITFIVTYGSSKCNNAGSYSGGLTFNFDPAILEPVVADGTNGMISYDGNYNYNFGTAPAGTIDFGTVTLTGKEQRTIFLRFKTKTGTTGQTSAVNPKVTLNFTGTAPCDAGPSTYEITDLISVGREHDPNEKTIDPITESGLSYLEFAIHFQNDGNAPAKTVYITDELDQYLGCNDQLTDLLFPPTSNAVLTLISPNNIVARKFKVKLDYNPGQELKGTHQAGYGTQFFEADTKGTLIVKVPVCPGALMPCNAVMNRAEIRFGCNPPINTNTAIHGINCAESLTGVDSCVVTKQAYSAVVTAADTASPTNYFLPALANLDLTGYADAELHWYPEGGLNVSDPRNPKLLELRNQEYTLVASHSCTRLIFTRKVIVPCDLKLQPPTISTNTVPGQAATYTVGETFLGGSNSTQIEWQDCMPHTSFSYPNVGPGTYYFSVYDPATGCSDEKWVSTIQVSDPVLDCDAVLKITGEDGALSYLWQYEDNNGTPHFSSQDPPFNMSGKNNVVVTVTDSNGNTAVFTPAKNCPAPFSWTNYLWFALAMAVIGALIWRWIKRP